MGLLYFCLFLARSRARALFLSFSLARSLSLACSLFCVCVYVCVCMHACVHVSYTHARTHARASARNAHTCQRPMRPHSTCQHSSLLVAVSWCSGDLRFGMLVIGLPCLLWALYLRIVFHACVCVCVCVCVCWFVNVHVNPTH